METKYVLLFLVLITSNAMADLKSPWDYNYNEKSVIDNKIKFLCPSNPIVSSNLIAKEGIYSDVHGSVRDTVKVDKLHKQITPIMVSAQNIAKVADQFIATNDKQFALCGSYLLEQLANENAIVGNIDGFQAYFTQAWILSSVSLSWLKMRINKDISSDTRNKINDWIYKISEQNKAFFVKWDNQELKKNEITNMFYWSGLAISASGVVLNDNNNFQWGIQKYKTGAQQINANGYLPGELKRGAAARGYHLFSLAPLIMICELAAANNINLYHYNNSAIQRLVDTTVHSIVDPTEMKRLSGGYEQIKMEKSAPLGWLVTYNQRFPKSNYEEVLKKYPKVNYFYLGGDPAPAVNLKSIK